MAEDKVIPSAKVGESTALLDGDILATQVFDEKGTPKLETGRFVGWQYGGGRAWLRTDVVACIRSLLAF